MKLTHTRIIAIFVTFLLCFFTHFIYDWFPNQLFAIFFPVNESIWEHMKMMFTTILIYGIIDYFILYKFNIKINNFILSLFASSIISIPIYLILFLPIYNKFGNSLLIDLVILFITLIIAELIKYYIMKYRKIKYQAVRAITFIIISYIIFGYLTYKPLLLDLFYDKEKSIYGLNNYQI